MNIKIYFNTNYLELTSDSNPLSDDSIMDISLSENFNKHIIKEILDNFLENNASKNFRISFYDPSLLIEDIKKHFKYIEAAGGFIEKQGLFLFIFRNNIWDLPKGKLEKKEVKEEGAIRECEEECGIDGLKITGNLKPSYHVYFYKGGFALKKTHWFYMKTNSDKLLVPQLEENITEVKWFKKDEIDTIVSLNTYITIKDVIREALNN